MTPETRSNPNTFTPTLSQTHSPALTGVSRPSLPCGRDNERSSLLPWGESKDEGRVFAVVCGAHDLFWSRRSSAPLLTLILSSRGEADLHRSSSRPYLVGQ